MALGASTLAGITTAQRARKPIVAAAKKIGGGFKKVESYINPLSRVFGGLFGGGIKKHSVTYLDPKTGGYTKTKVRGNPLKQRPIEGFNRPVSQATLASQIASAGKGGSPATAGKPSPYRSAQSLIASRKAIGPIADAFKSVIGKKPGTANFNPLAGRLGSSPKRRPGFM